MIKDLKQFGESLKTYRIKAGFTIRKICRELAYDPSNWSKIERGLISPPSEVTTLEKWVAYLGLSENEGKDFIYKANIAQGIIPQDILSNKNAVQFLPAFFRTIGNKKPSKKDLDNLIELIRKS